MKKWFTTWAVLFLLCLSVPSRADAANPKEVKLSAGAVYSGYDITGDQAADEIQITQTGIHYYRGRVTYIDGLTISVNGNTAYSFSNDHYYELETVLYTLSNGKPFLYLYAQADNGDGPVCGLFQYKNGALKQVVDFQTFVKYASHQNGRVKSVSGNKMTLDFSAMSYAASSVDVNMRYQYKGGTMKPVSRIGSLTCYPMKRTGYLTARKNIAVYKSTTSGKAVFTIKKGEKVKLLSCYIKGSNVRFKAKRLLDGKTGWIKSPKKFLSGGKGLFEEAMYAG